MNAAGGSASMSCESRAMALRAEPTVTQLETVQQQFSYRIRPVDHGIMTTLDLAGFPTSRPGPCVEGVERRLISGPA